MPQTPDPPVPEPSPARPERLKAKQAKKLMIEFLAKYPIVEAACAKIGISRSTHYEWMKKDPRYQVQVETATELSTDVVNDIAESNIINGVKKGEFKSTRLWLEKRHPKYQRRAESSIPHPIDDAKDEALSPELEAEIRRAVRFAIPRGCQRPHTDGKDPS